MNFMKSRPFMLVLLTLTFFSGGISRADEGYFPEQRRSLGGGEPDFLPVDEAFQLTATREDSAIRLRWQIMPGYYLYRHRLSFEVTGGEVGKPVIPAGKPKHDEHFGDVEVYYDELVVTLPLPDGASVPATLTVGYQGCADAGLCYPPQKRTVIVADL